MASYLSYRFPGSRKLITFKHGKQIEEESDDTTVDLLFTEMIRSLFTPDALKPEILRSVQDFVVQRIERYTRSRQRHPWRCASPLSANFGGQPRKRHRKYRRINISAALMRPIPVNVQQKEHQREVLATVKQADVLKLFEDASKIPRSRDLRNALEAEFPKEKFPERELDYNVIAKRIDSNGYDTRPGHCYLGVYQDIEAMCYLMLRFFGPRLQFFIGRGTGSPTSDGIKGTSTSDNSSKTGSSDVEQKVDEAAKLELEAGEKDDVVGYLDSIALVTSAVNVAQIAEPDSRSLGSKSPLYNLLPGPMLDEQPNGRTLWNFLRTLRSCDTKAAFFRRPPDDCFPSQQAKDAYVTLPVTLSSIV